MKNIIYTNRIWSKQHPKVKDMSHGWVKYQLRKKMDHYAVVLRKISEISLIIVNNGSVLFGKSESEVFKGFYW